MAAVRSLLAKELVQHRGALAGLTVLLALALLVLILAAAESEGTLSRLQAAGAFVVFFVPLAALVLGHRLVVVEYHGRTQLFVESLPIRRHQPVLVKYLLGLAYLLIVSWLATLAVAAIAARTEPIEPRFIVVLASKVTAFVFFVWGFLFAMGFMGRLRVTLYLLIAGVLGYLEGATEIDLLHQGPIGLMDPQTFAFERGLLPVADLIQTVTLGTACLAWSLALALLRDGSVAESLSRPMSQREKATAGVVLMGLLLAIAAIEEKGEKPPYRFTESAVVESASPPVSVLYLRERYRPAASALLERTSASLAALRDAAGIASYPAIHVAIATGLDPGVFQTATLDAADGVLVRANFQDLDAARRTALDAYLLRAVLARTTNGRARFEPKRWLHDGFSLWWVLHGAPAPGAGAPPDRIVLRALVAAGERGVDAGRVARWARTRETLGEPLAVAFAYSGLAALEELAGRDAVLALARAVLGRSPPRDVRESLHEWRHPMPHLLEETTGVAWPAFLARWNVWLEERRTHPRLRALLAALPRVEAGLEPGTGVGGIRALRYRFDLAGLEGAAAICTLLHEKLSPFDGEIPRARLQRVDTPCRDGATGGEVTGRYGAGEIALVVMEVEAPGPLGAPLRVRVDRVVVP